MKKPLLITLLLFLAVFSSPIFAVSIQDAYATCQAARVMCTNGQLQVTQQGSGVNSNKLYNGCNGNLGTQCAAWSTDTCPTPSQFSVSSGICTGCPSGYTYHSSTNSCDADVVCTAGIQKTIIVQDADMPANNPPTYYLHDHKVIGTTPTAIQGGCEYALPSSGYNNCEVMPGPPRTQVCRVLATQTGTINQSGDTAIDPATVAPTNASDCPSFTTWASGRCTVDKADNDCMRTPTGDQICNSHPKHNCGLVNGVEVCVSADGSVNPTLNGSDTSSTNSNGQPTNCIKTTDGDVVCIKPPTVGNCSSGAFSCLQPEITSTSSNPDKTPLDKTVETKTSTTTTQNNLGGTTIIEITTQNIIDSEPLVKTVVRDANGNVVSTTYSGGQGHVPTDSNGRPLTGSGNGSTQFDGNVSDSGTHTLLDSIKGILNGIGTSISSIKDAITGQGTTPAQPTDDLDTIFGDNETQAQNALGSATGYITSTINLPATGSCDFPTMTYKGHTSTFDPCPKLSPIKEILGWILYIMTFIAIVEIATRGST